MKYIKEGWCVTLHLELQVQVLAEFSELDLDVFLPKAQFMLTPFLIDTTPSVEEKVIIKRSREWCW